MCVSNIASMCYIDFARTMTHLTHKSLLASRGKGLVLGHCLKMMTQNVTIDDPIKSARFRRLVMCCGVDALQMIERGSHLVTIDVDPGRNVSRPRLEHGRASVAAHDDPAIAAGGQGRNDCSHGFGSF